MRVIAGPCQHENLHHSLEIATECKRVCDLYNIDYYYKASFDKANRTSADSARGQGIDRTLTDFHLIKEKIDVRTLTDVHEREQIDYIMQWYDKTVDVFQIPAFLCRQTDLIMHACNSGKIVNIKKGQFLAPWDVEGVLSKTKSAKEVWITERGTSFGYNNLVVDYAGLAYMLNHYNVDIFLDCTHSVQKPGGMGKVSGGNREYVAPLSRAASALGVSNFFLEVHPDPDHAPSDGPNMIKLEDFESIIRDIVAYHYVRGNK